MSSDGSGRRAVLAINDRGLMLGLDGTTWIVWDENVVWPAGDYLVWLLPLFEKRPEEITEALGELPVNQSPLSALVRFGLTSWGTYWPARALGWLEAGWPVAGVLDLLATMKDSTALPQPLRHRALRLWRTAAND